MNYFGAFSFAPEFALLSPSRNLDGDVSSEITAEADIVEPDEEINWTGHCHGDDVCCGNTLKANALSRGRAIEVTSRSLQALIPGNVKL